MLTPLPPPHPPICGMDLIHTVLDPLPDQLGLAFQQGGDELVRVLVLLNQFHQATPIGRLQEAGLEVDRAAVLDHGHSAPELQEAPDQLSVGVVLLQSPV